MKKKKTTTVSANLENAVKEKDLLSFLGKIDYKTLYSKYKKQLGSLTFNHTREESLEILAEVVGSWSVRYLISSLPKLSKEKDIDIDTYWNSLSDKEILIKDLRSYLKSFPHTYTYYIGLGNIKENELFEKIDFTIANNYKLQGINQNPSDIDISPANGYGLIYQYQDMLTDEGFKKGNNLVLKGLFSGHFSHNQDIYRIDEGINKILALMILVDIFRINTTKPLEKFQKIIYLDEELKLQQKTLSAETSSLLQSLELNIYIQHISSELVNALFKTNGDFKQKPLDQRIKETIEAHRKLFEKILDTGNTQKEIEIFRNLLNIYTQILGATKGNIKYILLVSLLENIVKLNGSFPENLQVEMDTVSMVICNKKGTNLNEKIRIKEAIEDVYHERNSIVHQAKNNNETDKSFYEVLFIATSLMKDFLTVIK